MKIKYIAVFAFTALLFEGLNAQQEGMFSQYWTLPIIQLQLVLMETPMWL